LKIHFTEIEKYRIDIKSLYLLYLLYLKNEKEKVLYEKIEPFLQTDYQFLLRKNWIALKEKNLTDPYLFKNLYVTASGITLLEECTDAPKFDLFSLEQPKIPPKETWINDWRNLWPKGVKSGGYPVRSNTIDIHNKMIKVMKKYKIDKDLIFKATELYLSERQREGYGYIQTASNFISKDQKSTLADFCDRVSSGDSDNLITNYKQV